MNDEFVSMQKEIVVSLFWDVPILAWKNWQKQQKKCQSAYATLWGHIFQIQYSTTTIHCNIIFLTYLASNSMWFMHTVLWGYCSRYVTSCPFFQTILKPFINHVLLTLLGNSCHIFCSITKFPTQYWLCIFKPKNSHEICNY
jgi:hypothetical protein